MALETRYARTADGTHVAYQVSGEGPMDMLVMRGWYSNLEHEWEDPVVAGILRRLGSLGRVIRLDRRGTGLSDRFEPTTLPTLENRMDDIRAVLDAARSERVVPIGLGHGGSLCAFLAAAYPERTAGLVLWAPPPTMLGQAEPARLDALGRPERLDWGTLESAHRRVAASAPSRTDDQAFVEWLRDEERLTGTLEEAAAQWELVSHTNIASVLPTIHARTLVARRSRFLEVSADVARLLPNASVVELPGADYMLISGDWRTPLNAIEDFIDSLTEAAPELDRVLSTVMFTDIAGSTDLAARLGDRDWANLLARHHAIVRRELARFHGREIDTAGDGFFASFDAPARAIRCGVAIRAALEEIDLAVRIGLHSGECERVGNGLRGVAVHLGARIAASATPGEVLASSTVRDLVFGSGISFEEAGVREFKGVPESWRVYRVRASESIPTRPSVIRIDERMT